MRASERTRGVEREIADLAGRQYGIVTRAQLATLGLRRESIGRRLRAGRLHRFHQGVFAVGHRVIPREGRWLAAVRACGAAAALSHWSAAALWGIRSYGGESIHVTSPSKTKSQGAIVRHFAIVPADEVTGHDEIPVTTMPRTILDLASVASADVVENALREAEYLEIRDRLSLHDLVARYPGRRGIRKVRTALARIEEEPSGRRRSPLEERFVPFLRRHHLPIPRLNAWIEAGGRRYQVDCLWPRTDQIVELDGWQGHGTKSAFRDDRARDRRLRVAGYSITHLTWSQLDDEPAAIAADLRVLLKN